MELECCLKKKKNKKQINHLFFKWFLCHENMSSILGIHMQIIHEFLFHAADLKFCVGKCVLHLHSTPTELAADLQLVWLWSFLRWLHNLPKHHTFIFPLVSQEHLSQDYSKDGDQNEGAILPPFVVHGLLWSTFDGSASFRRVLLMI
jgi:hypothetical protein